MEFRERRFRNSSDFLPFDLGVQKIFLTNCKNGKFIFLYSVSHGHSVQHMRNGRGNPFENSRPYLFDGQVAKLIGEHAFAT